MRTREPRIHPVTDDELDAEQKQIVDGLNDVAQSMNLFRTMLRYPVIMKAMMPWSNYVSSKKNDLLLRHREMVVLRTSYVCKSGYEWTYHVWLGGKAGLSDEEIAAIKGDPSQHDWAPHERALLKACDELNTDNMITDGTWSELAAHFTEKQLTDLVYTSAHYSLVAKFANSLGVQMDPGRTVDPDLIKYE